MEGDDERQYVGPATEYMTNPMVPCPIMYSKEQSASYI